MVDAGSYILSAAALAAVALPLGFAAYRLRTKLLPAWTGAPARLVEVVTAVALLIWLGEALGIANLLYGWSLAASSLLLAGAVGLWVRPVASTNPSLPGGDVDLGDHPEQRPQRRGGGAKSAAGPAGPESMVPRVPPLALLITTGVIAVVFAHWGLTTKDALDRGIFNFDSLWYHMPFAAEIARTHSVTGLHYTETVFTNWFYPQNSELLHATGILLTGRDTLALFINLGWLGVAFLAAWCVGRPWGHGHLSVAAAAVVLACHTLVVREPGAAKNDVVVAALLLAAVAILVNAWAARTGGGEGRRTLAPGWPLAAAGLAVGLAVGTKLTALALAAGLTIAVLALAPTGRRRAAARWWFLPALAGGGYWYLRNLIAAGNPLPQVESIGPVSLPHPEQLQSGRPDFTVLHYATDTGVWREYFGPGLEQAFGTLWPVVLALAVAGPLLVLLAGRERGLRWLAGVALFGMAAYLVTPLSAAGAEGEPEAFSINVRFLVPALLVALALMPLALPTDGTKASPYATESSRRRAKWVEWGLLGALLALLVLTDRSDAVLRDPDRLFGLLVALLAVLIPAALLFAHRRGASRRAVAASFTVLALAVVAVGYPLQRDYLADRFRNSDPETAIPGMGLDSAYRWAKGIEDARIGLAGTTAGFLQYGFYGDDLSNRVRYLGLEGPRGAFLPIPTCREFRVAVNESEFDYLVTAPFLNFIDPERPIRSPEAGWLRGEPAVEPVVAGDKTAVWRVRGRLDPSGCGPRNAPLRSVPQQPA